MVYCGILSVLWSLVVFVSMCVSVSLCVRVLWNLPDALTCVRGGATPILNFAKQFPFPSLAAAWAQKSVVMDNHYVLVFRRVGGGGTFFPRHPRRHSLVYGSEGLLSSCLVAICCDGK